MASQDAVTAVLRPALVIQRLTVQNVIGTLGPAGPAADELVAAGAHLDHEGVDAARQRVDRPDAEGGVGLHPDYHTPNDDADRLDFAKLERIAELAGRLAWLVGDGEPPRFEPAR